MNSKQREALYERCRGDKEFPECNLCHLPIATGQDWDESHIGAPKALGGRVTGCAHRRCNRHHGSQVVTPMVAKAVAAHRKHIGAWRPKRPMQAGRTSNISKSFRHGIVPRLTLSQKLEQLGLVER
jgi:hypothetical protein